MKTKRFLLAVITILVTATLVHAGPPEEGKTIFTTRCAGCHNVNKILTGPALAGVYDRRSIDWIIKFVKSSQTLVKAGDKDAVTLFQKFNRIPMPDHPDLTADNIKNIVEYIRSEAVAVDTKTPFAKPTIQQPAYVPFSLTKDFGLFASYMAVVILLIAALLFAVRLKDIQRKTLEK